MDPNNQYPRSPQGNPYEFILNPNQAPKKRGGKLGNHFALTIALIVGGTVIVLIILAVVLNTVSPKKVGTADITGLAQTETEILRISRAASDDAVQQTTKNLATTVQYTMITQQQQTLAVLAKNGVNLKVGSKELSLKQDATTDQKFATAKSTSTYDQTYTEIIQTSLTNYANTLKQLSQQSSSQSERDRTSDYYRQVQLLISQIPYAQDKITSANTPVVAQ